MKYVINNPKLFSAWKIKLVTMPNAIYKHKISFKKKLNSHLWRQVNTRWNKEDTAWLAFLPRTMKEIGKTMFWMHTLFPKEHVIYYTLPVFCDLAVLDAILFGCND